MIKYLALIIYACMSVIIRPGLSFPQAAGQWHHYFSHNYVTSLASKGDTLCIGYDYGFEERSISTGNYRMLLPGSSGLKANFIISIQIGPSGNKWMSVEKTEDVWNRYGLVKFNGKDWAAYTETDSGYPLYPSLFALDSSGNVWIPGNNMLIRFDGNNWTMFKSDDPGVTWERAKSVAVDNSGNKWIGAYEKLVKFNGTKWESLTPPGSFSSSVNAIAFDSKNNLWAGTINAGLMKFDGSTWTVYNTSNASLPGNSITALYIDKKDNIWAGLGRPYPDIMDSSYGLAKFDRNNWTIYNTTNSGIPSNYVTAITGDIFGNIWTGTYDRGFAKFDGTEWQTYNTSNSSLPAINITSIVVGPEDNKWFTSENGLSKLQGNSWKLYDKSNSGLPDNFVNAVAFDSSNNKWIATKSGLVKYDNKSWSLYDTSSVDMPGDFIWSVAIDHKGVIWFGSSVFQPSNYSLGGLVRFDGMNWKVFTKANSILPSNVVNIIKIDSYGNKWFVYSGMDDYGDSPLQLFGLFKYNDTTWINYLDYGGLPIYAAEFDTQGKIWVGGRGFGLTVYDGQEWIDYYRKNSAIPCDTVTAIAADSNGFMWIGTMQGLAVTNGTDWKTYNTLNSELRSNEINALAADDSNYLWIAQKNNFVSSLKLGKDIFTGTETARAFSIKDFSLSQNYPNPFNPATTIAYYLPHSTGISLRLYDILGREAATIEEGFRTAGIHKITFNASALPSGVYIYRLQAGNFLASRKLLLIK